MLARAAGAGASSELTMAGGKPSWHGYTRSVASLPTSRRRWCRPPTPAQDEMRSEAMFSQMLDRTFKDEAAEKMMSMVDE